MHRNGVQLRGVGAVRNVRAGAPRLVDELLDEKMRALVTLALNDRGQRIDPLAGFHGIDIGRWLLIKHPGWIRKWAPGLWRRRFG